MRESVNASLKLEGLCPSKVSGCHALNEPQALRRNRGTNLSHAAIARSASVWACKHRELQLNTNPPSALRIHIAVMATLESIGTLAGRIESFIADHHLAKRRASSLKKRAGGNAVTWPHTFLAAEQVMSPAHWVGVGDADDTVTARSGWFLLQAVIRQPRQCRLLHLRCQP